MLHLCCDPYVRKFSRCKPISTTRPRQTKEDSVNDCEIAFASNDDTNAGTIHSCFTKEDSRFRDQLCLGDVFFPPTTGRERTAQATALHWHCAVGVYINRNARVRKMRCVSLWGRSSCREARRLCSASICFLASPSLGTLPGPASTSSGPRWGRGSF